jgi:hypothetical protein
MRININKYCSVLGSILLSAFLFSCTDEIDITLKNADPKIVVYGSISTIRAAHRIMITQTVDTTATNSKTISGANGFPLPMEQMFFH